MTYAYHAYAIAIYVASPNGKVLSCFTSEFNVFSMPYINYNLKLTKSTSMTFPRLKIILIIHDLSSFY